MFENHDAEVAVQQFIKDKDDVKLMEALVFLDEEEVEKTLVALVEKLMQSRDVKVANKLLFKALKKYKYSIPLLRQ